MNDTLAMARVWLQAHLDEGVTCPCCGQHAQRYRWSLYSTAIRALLLYRRLGGPSFEWVHTNELKELGHKGQGDANRLAAWALAESQGRREDGGKSGYWRVKPLGQEFIEGRKIPKYVFIYDGKVERFDTSTWVTIYDRMGHDFNWRDHMRGEGD